MAIVAVDDKAVAGESNAPAPPLRRAGERRSPRHRTAVRQSRASNGARQASIGFRRSCHFRNGDLRRLPVAARANGPRVADRHRPLR